MPAIREMIILLYTNASTVHSTLVYKYASCSFNVAAKASISKQQSAVLSDEEVGEHLLLSESEESLSDSEFDTDNVQDDHAFLDVVVNDGSDEDDNITLDFVWENMENYTGQFHGQCWTSPRCKTCDRNCGRFLIVFR
jgi:hypothetical protein